VLRVAYMITLSDVIRLVRAGGALVAPIPAAIADAAGLRPGEPLYARLVSGSIIYSREPARGAKRVRVRAQARYVTRDGRVRLYLAVAVPARMAAALGLREGDRTVVALTRSGLRVTAVKHQ